jgi:hypothetical protein
LRYDFGSRKTSPKVRAGHVPFGADDCLLALMQAIIILMACLQQVSRVLALVFDLARKLRQPSRLPSLCNLFHSARTNSATWAVSYCNSRPFYSSSKAYALHSIKGG